MTILDRFAIYFTIMSDQTQHLLWRLTEGGELPASLHPDVVVLLIGTNNIAHAAVEDIAHGIQNIANVIHQHSHSSTLLVNEIFPRYDDQVVKTNTVVNVRKLNDILKGIFVSDNGDSASSSLRYLQCGSLFDPTSSQRARNPNITVDKDLMPDLLHPNAVGMQKWLTECIIPAALDVKLLKDALLRSP